MKEVGFDCKKELHPKQQVAFTTIANEILYGRISTFPVIKVERILEA